MDQPPAVAFTAFADVWPRATGNGDRRRPMRNWCGRNFDFFDVHIQGYESKIQQIQPSLVIITILL